MAREIVTWPVFEGLAERFEHVPLELGKLVEEEHAVVRQAHLAGLRDLSAADKTGIGNRMVRGTVRSRGDERLAFPEQAHDAVDLGGLDGLVEAHPGKDRRQAAREHGLARSRRPDHDDVVSARSGDLDGSLGMLLSFYLGEILLVRGIGLEGALDIDAHGIEGGGAGEELHHLRQGLHAVDRDGLDDGRLLRVVFRDHHAAVPGLFRKHGHGERAPHRLDPAVEGELAHDEVAVHHLLGEDALGDQHADGDGQVEGGAFLLDVRGGEIDDDLLEGKIEARVLERGAYALFALFDGGVGQAHGGEEGKSPARDVNLHLDRIGVDAQHSGADDLGEHDDPFY